MAMASKTMDMTKGPLFVKILKLSVPMIFTGILQLLFSTADLIVIGQFAGSGSLAAVGATTSLNHLIINLVLGLSVGANVLMSQAIGAKNRDKAERVVHTSMLLAIVAGAAFSLIGFFISRPALTLMKTDPEVLDKATLYLEIIFLGTIANVVYNFGAAILRAKGDTTRPLIYLTIAGVVNVILNIVFVVVLKMDVEGVAIPTVASQVLSAVLVVIALLREKGECRFIPKKLRFHATEVKEILGIGVPSGVLSSLFSIANVLIQSQVNSFGKEFMAASSASSSIEAFTYVAMNAVSSSTSAVVGQNYGAGRKKRIVTAMWQSSLLIMIAFAVIGGPTMIFARPFASLYNSEPHVIDYTLERLFVIMPTYFLCGLAEVFISALRGIGHSTAPTIAAIGCVCAYRIVWVNTVFVWFRSIEVLFACYPISYVLELIVLPVMFVVFYRKLPPEKVEKEEAELLAEEIAEDKTDDFAGKTCDEPTENPFGEVEPQSDGGQPDDEVAATLSE